MDIELFWGSPNSRKGPQNHNENGDPGSPFSWGPQNFMTPVYQVLPGTRCCYCDDLFPCLLYDDFSSAYTTRHTIFLLSAYSLKFLCEAGDTEVIARLILAGKSVGVHSFFPVYIKMRGHFSVGVHSFFPVNNRAEPRVQGYTLSFLLITGSQECRDTLFLSSVY